jgi:hypothetical protein
MTHSELPPDMPENIDATFAALMGSVGDMYIEDEHCAVSLAPVVDRLVAVGIDIVIELSLQAHAMTAADWPECFAQANLRLAREFEQITELQYGDEVVASGRTTAIPVDMHTGEISPDFQVLSDDVYLRGTLDSVGFGEIPAYDYLPKIIGEVAAGGQDLDDFKDGSYFGVRFHITNASIKEQDCTAEEMSADVVMVLPLNYPGLKLGRIIREDAV